ncbi:MAG: hypothetical protein A2901_02770 [Elusimicrobia bacterium RIFCSPLOWO2_01_FULL_54_10]|nr:MAG: hypothetical protein A2901_02770 [Elusimicrobia bacterium RIFCSPLOWO2_01_FULL_54_10]
MKKPLRSAALLLLGLAAGSGAVNAGYLLTPGEAGSQFLTMPISARSVALGSGLSGVAGDIHAFEYNPAATATLEDNQLTFTRSVLFQGSDLTSFAIGLQPIKSVSFALQYRRFGSSDKERDMSGYDLEREVDISDNGLSFGMSRMFMKRFSVGYNAEYLRRNLHEHSANTVNHNVGVQWHFNKRHVLGFSAQNIGRSIQFLEQHEPMPIVFRVGGSHKFKMMSNAESEPNLMGVWELNQFRDSQHPGGSAGAEWQMVDFFILRAGLQYREDARPTAGIGLRWQYFQLDYGILSRSEAGIAHTVSVMVRWDSIDGMDLGD